MIFKNCNKFLSRFYVPYYLPFSIYIIVYMLNTHLYVISSVKKLFSY